MAKVRVPSFFRAGQQVVTPTDGNTTHFDMEQQLVERRGEEERVNSKPNFWHENEKVSQSLISSGKKKRKSSIVPCFAVERGKAKKGEGERESRFLLFTALNTSANFACCHEKKILSLELINKQDGDLSLACQLILSAFWSSNHRRNEFDNGYMGICDSLIPLSHTTDHHIDQGHKLNPITDVEKPAYLFLFPLKPQK